MKKFRIMIVVIAAIILNGCMKSVSVKPSSNIAPRFVELDRTIKFDDVVYTKGSQFEILTMEDGSRAVIISSNISTSVASGGGIAIAIPDKVKLGIFVNDELCATDNWYRNIDDPIFGSTFDTYEMLFTEGKDDLRIWSPKNFCFSEV
ncbi:hypothetical protein XMD420_001093 [Marinobacterium sp. xm-d-420]|uniref:hypothetical protein n=1 Tax=Marinobacterium sp. xm-d-420 TaxID=2497737 RepID=UPI0015680335|nr:hypothetical protein [Marinobacterium sp. xm-d-420]NRP27489.1 hypothetical protein [Marinobacterium sp. xm-d-420]